MKRKLTLLAQALVLVDSLSADEQQTLADYLRGKLPQATRRPKSTAPSVGKKSSRNLGTTDLQRITRATRGVL